MVELRWGASTDKGLRRARNEDAFLAEPPIFVVADGMGGHHRGDVASALAVESLRALGPQTPSRTELLDAIRLGHEAITLVGSEQASEGMGTTLCGLAQSSEGAGERLLAFNIGDSRVYRFEGKTLQQVSHDHSVVQELIDDRSITPADAATHPERHVVTRSLGSGGPVEIDWWDIEPVPGERFLLCSDGLVKELPDAAIAEILAEAAHPQELTDRLMTEALAAGGRDNVTIVIIDVLTVAGPAELNPTEPETQPRSLVPTDHHDITSPTPTKADATMPTMTGNGPVSEAHPQ